MPAVDNNTPVLVGIGTILQQTDDLAATRDPAELMIDAVRAAARDAGCDSLPEQAQRIAVPQGMWGYSDPARLIADAVGARNAHTVLAKIGILQQTLFGDACARIQRGEIEVAIVAGGEARYRQLQASIQGIPAAETEQTDITPDTVLEPGAELWLKVESDSGLQMPTTYYAVMESAFRAAQGLSVDTHRDRIAQMYARFTEIAAANPWAWKRETLRAEQIRDPIGKNRMLAFPYTKLHNSSWNVDQAGALIFCSAAKARQLGIPESQWIYPLASTESNHMLAVSQRPDLARLPGARIGGAAALDAAGLRADQLDLVELYSCFPVAVEVYAQALGIPLDGSRDLTVTGGMPFAGGPLNNYVIQSTCRMAELLRGKPGANGLVSSVSGMLTKQGFGLWSSAPGNHPFANIDVTADVARANPARTVLDDYQGRARIAGFTVLFEKDAPTRLVAVCDVDASHRCLAFSEAPAWLAKGQAEELVGHDIKVEGMHIRD